MNKSVYCLDDSGIVYILSGLEQRMAVAEYRGWVWRPPTEIIHPNREKFWHPYPRSTDPVLCSYQTNLPDYYGDLNAVHAVAHELPDELQKAMRFYLWRICGQMHAHMADSHQFLEAYLRTIKRWKE